MGNVFIRGGREVIRVRAADAFFFPRTLGRPSRAWRSETFCFRGEGAFGGYPTFSGAEGIPVTWPCRPSLRLSHFGPKTGKVELAPKCPLETWRMRPSSVCSFIMSPLNPSIHHFRNFRFRQLHPRLSLPNRPPIHNFRLRLLLGPASPCAVRISRRNFPTRAAPRM